MTDLTEQDVNRIFLEKLAEITAFHELEHSYFDELLQVAKDELLEVTINAVASGDVTSKKMQYKITSLTLRIEILENFVAIIQHHTNS